MDNRIIPRLLAIISLTVYHFAAVSVAILSRFRLLWYTMATYADRLPHSTHNLSDFDRVNAHLPG